MSELNLPKCRMFPTHLEIEDGATMAELSLIGESLFAVHGASPVWIGDWLNTIEKRYGETYTQAVEITKLDVDTLAHYKSVMGRVPPTNRVEGLNYSHYRCVAKLPPEDQRPRLQTALDLNLTVSQFRQHIRDYYGEEAVPKLRKCDSCGLMAELEPVKMCDGCRTKRGEA